MLSEGRNRVIIEGVEPEIDGGAFAIKRTPGEAVTVEADIFGDGHDVVSCALLHRREQEKNWRQAPMTFLVNDRWRGVFTVDDLGRYVYTIVPGSIPSSHGAVTCRKRWRQGKKPSWIRWPAHCCSTQQASAPPEPMPRRCKTWARSLRAKNHRLEDKVAAALSDEWAALMETYPDSELATRYSKELGVVVERAKARFSAWYELFPRSCAADRGAMEHSRLRAVSAANRKDGFRHALSAADPPDRAHSSERQK